MNQITCCIHYWDLEPEKLFFSLKMFDLIITLVNSKVESLEDEQIAKVWVFVCKQMGVEKVTRSTRRLLKEARMRAKWQKQLTKKKEDRLKINENYVKTNFRNFRFFSIYRRQRCF